MDELVTVERVEGGVAVVRLNRPDVLNALNIALRQALAEAFLALHDDEAVRAIVLTGAGRAFAAGADLAEFAEASAVEIFQRRAERYWKAVAETPQPVIAAVEGYALGGGLELAMACDMIVVGESAELGQPEVRVGIMPGAGGTQRLARAVGKFRAMKMCLDGRPVSGRTAYEMGLASKVVPDGEALAAALKLAATVARMPPIAARLVKECILQGQNASLEAGLALERRAFQLTFATEDQTEGMAAFLEKRRATFKGS